MKNWKLVALIVLLAVTILPAPHALASIVDCGSTIDNCPVVGAPEPGTLLLFASGLAGVMGTAWRRHRRK
jgi:hypothetical protein